MFKAQTSEKTLLTHFKSIPGSVLAYVCTSTPSGPRKEAMLSPTACRNGGPTGTSPAWPSLDLVSSWRSHFTPPLLQRGLPLPQRRPPLRPQPRPHGPKPCPKSVNIGGWWGGPWGGWWGGTCGGWNANGLKPWNQLFSGVLGVAIRSISCSLWIPLVSQVRQRSKLGHTTHLKRIPKMCFSQPSQTTPGCSAPDWSSPAVVWKIHYKN